MGTVTWEEKLGKFLKDKQYLGDISKVNKLEI